MIKDKDDVFVIKPLEVKVTGRFEDALRFFRSEVQKEKILSEFKDRQRYEKPSDKKRRKQRESIERMFVNELRMKQIKSGEWEKKQKLKEEKRAARHNRSNISYEY